MDIVSLSGALQPRNVTVERVCVTRPRLSSHWRLPTVYRLKAGKFDNMRDDQTNAALLQVKPRSMEQVRER